MLDPQFEEPVSRRRDGNTDRFVAFAFAGSDIIAEVDAHGFVTYAAGAIRSMFGRSPEACIGMPLRDLISPGDHEMLDGALLLLAERGRLPPVMIRLADPARSHFALAGIALTNQERPARLCLSFARPPVTAASAVRNRTPHGLARLAESRLRAGSPCDLGLLEAVNAGTREGVASAIIEEVLDAVAPDASASQIAPGRFGVFGHGAGEADLLSIADRLEAMLRARGVDVSVAARRMSLETDGLSQVQVARALRHALNVFARQGIAGVDKAGFDGTISGYIRRARAQANSLRGAIRDRRFDLLFQPIVNLADRQPCHYEALIRPRPLPGSEINGTADFVMTVEALGLADELDLTVARVACDIATRSGVNIAFNLSGQSVQSTDFRDRLAKILAVCPARAAGLIMVEMTETAELDNVEEAGRTAEMLRSLGIPFCLDDFGAGAADVRLLRALTPDIVKLDGSYVPGICENGRERAFVAGMIEIARAAGAKIIAERVETEAEAEAFQQLGVRYGQGWLFGRPDVITKATRKISDTASNVTIKDGTRWRAGEWEAIA